MTPAARSAQLHVYVHPSPDVALRVGGVRVRVRVHVHVPVPVPVRVGAAWPARDLIEQFAELALRLLFLVIQRCARGP